MAQQTLIDFKNTDPGLGNVKFAYNNSNLITGLTISVNDCSGNSRIESISNLKSITFGSTVLNTENGEAYEGWYYYDVNPTVATSLVLSYTGSCSNADLNPAPAIDTFKNSDYNATFSNAIKIRRIQQTGSLLSTQSGVFEVDRKSNYVTPLNLNSIISGSATTASFQESNLYSKAWTSGRYDGSKLSSGSLFLNDPALVFTPFKAAKFSLFETSSIIRSSSTSDLAIEEFYHNPPFKQNRTGFKSYFQGSTTDRPPANQPVYELVGKEFKRITRSKLYIPKIDEIVNIFDYRVTYEPKPVPIDTSSNIFVLEMDTIITTQDYIRYWDETNTLQTQIIRPGNTEEIIVSASYLADLDEFSLDAPDSTSTRTAPYTQPWQSDAGREKTFVTRIVSQSRNIP